MSYPIERIALSVMLAASATACSTVASEAPSGVVREVGDVFLTANLSASGQAGIGGTVRAIDLPATEDIQVQVEATGLPPGPHAWHIHAGSCAQQGAVVVPFTPTRQMEGLDEDIRADANGEAQRAQSSLPRC